MSRFLIVCSLTEFMLICKLDNNMTQVGAEWNKTVNALQHKADVFQDILMVKVLGRFKTFPNP